MNKFNLFNLNLILFNLTCVHAESKKDTCARTATGILSTDKRFM